MAHVETRWDRLRMELGAESRASRSGRQFRAKRAARGAGREVKEGLPESKEGTGTVTGNGS